MTEIPDDAVVAASKAAWARYGVRSDEAFVRTLLKAAAPHMLAEANKEFSDAKRVIALLVLDAGGKATISSRSVTELSNDVVIETTQDVINGGWVIRAKQ